MKVSRRDLEWAASEGVISGGQAEDLWRALEGREAGRPRFDLPHVAYYFGAIVVISAMGWFMTLGWERFGGVGILAWEIFEDSLLFPFALSAVRFSLIPR